MFVGDQSKFSIDLTSLSFSVQCRQHVHHSLGYAAWGRNYHQANVLEESYPRHPRKYRWRSSLRYGTIRNNLWKLGKEEGINVGGALI